VTLAGEPYAGAYSKTIAFSNPQTAQDHQRNVLVFVDHLCEHFLGILEP
jgi:hypothetical protein